MRGQFIRRDGLILPNNVSLAGAEAILAAAFQGAAQSWYAALVSGPPTLDMTSADLTEPTIGTNGYARIEIAQSAVGWPVIAQQNNEMYVESDWLTWAAVGGDFNQAIQRLALLGTSTYTAGDDVLALSAPLPTEYIITPSTDLANRQFKYQLFL